MKAEISKNNITNESKRNTDYFRKTPYFKPKIKRSKYTREQQLYFTMFSFQHSQNTQEDFEQGAILLLK